MDAKLYCLPVAWNTTLVFKNFPMNKGTENTLALGDQTFVNLRNPCEAANSLRSPGNPSYQKHLKNFSTTSKLTWKNGKLTSQIDYIWTETRKYKLARSLTLGYPAPPGRSLSISSERYTCHLLSTTQTLSASPPPPRSQGLRLTGQKTSVIL